MKYSTLQLCVFILFITFSIYYFYLFTNNISSSIKCKNGKSLYLSLKLIRNKILSLNNNSIIKATEYIKNEFYYMKKNVDYTSKNNLDRQYRMILYIMFCNKLIKEFTISQVEEQNSFFSLLPYYKQQYNFSEYYPEVFYYKHGLYNLNNKILEYIKERDVLDIGAYRGDSLIILENYTNRIIYSYEISEYNVIKIYENMKVNHADYNKHRIIHKGLSNFNGFMYISNSGKAGVGLNDKGKLKINITTIDNEVEIEHINVGLIKGDVEGNALELIKGGKNTIINKLPVLSIAIYHNFEEYFLVRKYLDSLTSEYKYKYILANACEPYACEFSLIAYPKYLDV